MTVPRPNEDTRNTGRRKYHRKPYFMAIDYALKDRAFRDFIRDISAGGIFIETRNAIEAGQIISMTFPLPGDSRPLKSKGMIVRTAPGGVGVTFYPPSRKSSLQLESLIEMI